jgi:hypothetical protein
MHFWSRSTSIQGGPVETELEVPLWLFGLPNQAAIGARV